ncbi:hydrolase [Paenibacillus cisolokensis]|uniref:Hydrolase n=1 Tax=Paenibacillus cisolokensis TaxID=1658519 RepID=A0ABQ4N393_9BACL|nr:SGNH/GDSL hydrolase family protein [Paenibacillus cisolokensis]GIQ62630.1 hydrolase [Paenibacillus cisolokensis]
MSLGAAGWSWHDPLRPPIAVAGFAWLHEEGIYRRFPVVPPHPLPEAVDYLARHTAGGQIRFRTDSSRLAIRVRLAGPSDMYHMPATGQSGFDCYEEAEGALHYRSTARFGADEAEYEAVLIENGSGKMRTIVLNFPLYQGVEEVSVGLAPEAAIEAPPAYDRSGKIIVYGTSITQGACASRPGMCYTNVLSRRINMEFINLGFSGSGKGEPEVARNIAAISDPACLVLDYEANSVSPELYAETLPQFIRIYRETHPEVPILVLSRILFANQLFDDKAREMQQKRKAMQIELVRSLREAGDAHIRFFDGETLLRRHGQDCTVDGIHPTDLGLMQMADGLEPVIREMLGTVA